MSGKGVKRASPGADEQKNPLGEVELSDEDARKLGDVQKVMQRAEIALGESLRFYVVPHKRLTNVGLLGTSKRESHT